MDNPGYEECLDTCSRQYEHCSDDERKKPWPQKGDTVYVSAELIHIDLRGPMSSMRPGEVPLPLCAPLMIEESGSPEKVIRAKDVLTGFLMIGRYEFRGGGWLPFLHPDKKSCMDAFKKRGNPRFIRNKDRYLLQNE